MNGSKRLSLARKERAWHQAKRKLIRQAGAAHREVAKPGRPLSWPARFRRATIGVPVLKLRLASSAPFLLAETGVMKLYKTESQDLVRRFRHHQISLPFCISHLDMALDRFIPRMKLGDIDELRAVMLANNEAVMKELAERAVTAG